MTSNKFGGTHNTPLTSTQTAALDASHSHTAGATPHTPPTAAQMAALEANHSHTATAAQVAQFETNHPQY
jgi:hypothetical protein